MWYVSSLPKSIRAFLFCSALISMSYVGPVSAAMAIPLTPVSKPLQSNPNHVYAAASSIAPIKSYREWKLMMINESEGRLKSLKETVTRTKGSAASSATEAGLSSTLQNMLDKEELQLSLAQDLTISDYFVGYLTKQKSISAAIKEVSGRLSAEEVAELMTSYADNFFSSKPTPKIQAPSADSGL